MSIGYVPAALWWAMGQNHEKYKLIFSCSMIDTIIKINWVEVELRE